MKIFNVTRQTTIADSVVVADDFVSRMKGLLGRLSLPESHALVITRCQSIHMLFMKFPIDVLFIDKSGRIVGVIEKIKPYRFSPVFWNAHAAIELTNGRVERTGTHLGDFVQIVG